MSSLDRKQVTEKTLALGLSTAVNQHDAEAAKEENAVAGRGAHARQVSDVGPAKGGPKVALLVDPSLHIFSGYTLYWSSPQRSFRTCRLAGCALHKPLTRPMTEGLRVFHFNFRVRLGVHQELREFPRLAPILSYAR